MSSAETQPAEPITRDLRLDIVRGLALWFIVLDHIPDNVCDWLTLRHYGFSDTTEAFMFISGFTCAKAYLAIRQRDCWWAVVSHTLRRGWEIYCAFLLLIVALAVSVYLIADQHLVDETNIRVLFAQPGAALTHAMLLQYHPVNSDVLPFFVLSHLLFAPLLWLLLRSPHGMLALSVGVYVLAQLFGWNLPQWPKNHWYFNPFAWQVLIVLGAWWHLAGHRGLASLVSAKPVVACAILYLLFALIVALGWRVPQLANLPPPALTDWIYPIDKSDLDPLRLIHFLALAVVLFNLAPRWWKPETMIVRSLIRCGENSLEIYCLGVLVSLAAEALLLNLSNSLAMQIVVSFGGILLLSVFAITLTWVRKGSRRQAALL